ncbi:MAG: AAA family ATPase [Gammaproteobacteria bacterium]|nr:AAA family ATPase [Gammaproteobacteria bacterium]
MYQSYYNLIGKPFRLSPDPAFFFSSRGHKRALAYLRYGLSQNEGFVVITGAPGTGKTTLAQILLKEMGEKNVVVAHLTTTQLEADDMLRMVAASFGLRYENLDKTALLKTIESFLLARSREQKRALLVIDEAQNLPARSLEELRMLSNLQVGDKALLQTFLLGQAQFRQMLDHPDLEQLRQRVIANYHLSPLAGDEGQRYIESRLKLVGWDNNPHFAELAFELIHEYTEGVPRRINMLCDRILLFGCMEEKHEVTRELVSLVIQELEQEVSGTPIKPSVSDALVEQSQAFVEAKAAVKKKIPVAQKPTPKMQEKIVPTPTVRESGNHTSKSHSAAVMPETDVSKMDAATVLDTTSKLARSLKDITQSESPIERIPQDEGSLLYDTLHGKKAKENELFIEITEDFNELPTDNTQQREGSKQHDTLNAAPVSGGQHSGNADRADEASQVEAVSASNGGVANASKNASKKTKAVKVQKEASDKADLTSENEQQHAEYSEQVMGNTVKHTQPDRLDSDEASAAVATGGAAQFSERELFRVITGGKDTGGKNSDNEHISKPGKAADLAPAAHAKPSTEDVVLRRILRLVLAFHRSPSSFPGLDDPSQPLPEGVSELLKLAVADDQVLTKVSPAAVMGISPVMLRAAVRFFVRRTLFVANETDYCRILGLPAGASLARIERHYDLLMRLLRQDKQPGASDCVAKVGKAYEALTRNEEVTVTGKNVAVAAKENVVSSSEDKAASVLQALENPELTIDFGEEIKPEKKSPHISTYVAQGKEGVTPDPRVTRRRIHLLGQAAILGIGALVIVLGLFITQLQPTDTENVSLSTTTKKEVPQEVIISSQGLAATETLPKKIPSQEDQQSDSTDPGNSDDKLGQQENESFVGTAGETPEFVAPVAKLPRVIDSAGSTDSKTVSPPKMATPKTSATTHVSADTESTSLSILSSTVAVPVNEATSKIPMFDPAGGDPTSASMSPTNLSVSKFESIPVQPRSSVSVMQAEVEDLVADGVIVKPAQKFVAVPIESKAKMPSSKVIISSSEPQELPNVASEGEGTTFEDVVKKPFAGKASNTEILSVTTTKRQASVVAEFADSDQLDLSPETPVEKTSGVTQITAVDAPSLNDTISQQALNGLLTRFTEAYEAGDVTQIMALFAAQARTNAHASRAGIESDYKGLFDTSASRQVAISALFWDKEGGFARGVGKYKATVVAKDHSIPSIFEGKLTLQVQRESDNKLKITRFYLSNPVVLTEREVQPEVVSVVGPSQVELKNLLADFVQYYEAGNVDKLMQLFASNARTNDRSNLAGIRKDHVDLFQSSAVRQMFFKNTRWKITGKFARGKGGFEVMIQNKGEENFNSVSGSFIIKVEKTPTGVLITEFIHKTQ